MRETVFELGTHKTSEAEILRNAKMDHTWYRSTRGDRDIVKSSMAILRGVAKDGGLYVPDYLPHLGYGLREYARMTYEEIAKEIFSLFLTDYSQAEIHAAVDAVYKFGFGEKEVVPITCANGAYFAELWQTPTLSDKDLSVATLPLFMMLAKEKNVDRSKTVVVTATDGDSAKSVAESFKEIPDTEVMVFYPKDGVSHLQELQLRTQDGDRVHVCAVDGTIDEIYGQMNRILTDERLAGRMTEAGYRFATFNSVNIGRIISQIVNYVFAYACLFREGEIGEGYGINICVPTADFGSLLAAYYAFGMGLPVNRLLQASNTNRAVADFIRTGVYDVNRPLKKTAEPAMDRLIAPNMERLVYTLGGDSPDKTLGMMNRLAREGCFEVSYDMKDALSVFYAGFASEADTAAAIRHLFADTGYLVDPRTAVAYTVHQKYLHETGDDTATLIMSTDSPFKFPAAVLNALLGKALSDAGTGGNDFASAKKLSRLTEIPLPQQIRDLENEEIRHSRICDTDGMLAEVKRALKI